MGADSELIRLTTTELLAKLRSGEISPTDAVNAAFDQIEATEPKIGSFLFLDKKAALQRAKDLENEDKSLPLYGVPVAVKDNMCTKGVPTTCASKILEGFRPPYDATVVSKLKNAGAIIVGKTNLDEFAMGSSCENSGYQITHNPWNLDCVPGGSSGGSAAAVASDQAFLSIGSDTGGSIRQPAALCGVVGMKPTYGTVSRYGLIAFASSLDQIGPFSKSVEDCALMLTVLAGYDVKDSTSVRMSHPDYSMGIKNGIKGMKIGVITEFMSEGVDAGVKARIDDSIKTLESIGAEIGEVSLPNVKYCVPTYYLIAPAEASSNLARYDGVQYGIRAQDAGDVVTMFSRTRKIGFGDEVKRRIMLGTYALSAGYYDAYYLRAQKVRTLIIRDFNAAFDKFDLVVCPTSPVLPFKIGERVDDPISMYLADICTVPVNLASLPGISVPCGTADGLPVGMQLIGRAFAEPTLLQAAYAYEQAAGRLSCGFKA